MDIKTRIARTITILRKTEGQSMLAGFSRLDPWKILISTILSARAKDETTIPVCNMLFSRYPDAESLFKADPKEIENLIKKIGFYRNKTRFIIEASGMIVKDFNGKVPDNIENLLKLPGVGRKVANCVLVYAFRKPAIPVDTHVHRISNRLGWVNTKTPEKTEIELLKIVPRKLWIEVNERLVTFGKRICKPIGPLHKECPVSQYCQYYEDFVEKPKS